MRQHFRAVAAICIILILLLSACSHNQVNTTTEAPVPSFGVVTEPESEASQGTDDSSREESTDNTESSSAEESSSARESSSEEESSSLPPESSSAPEPSTEDPYESSPVETREELVFAKVNETVTATASVNVRADYSTESDIIAVLRRGETVTRIGYHEKWSKVIYNGEEYYVSSAYLTTETLPPETTAPETTAPVIVVPSYNHVLFDNLSSFTFTGRWFTKEYNGYTHYTTLNAGSELSFQISGTDCISIYLSTLNGNDGYFAYSIDGQSPIRQSISQSFISLGNTGAHTVRIIIDSIGEVGNRWEEGSGISIDGIELNGGIPSPWQYSNTTIAFYGDSITEGIRTRSTSEHSYISSYTWSCSQALNSLPVVCGFPGSGITTTGTFNTCANAITNYSSWRGSNDFDPAIVILSHGTNDINADSTTFSDGYKQVLDLLHNKFPNAKVACMIPVSQIHADDIRSCVIGKDWCTVVETGEWSVSYTDNIHPDATSSYNIGLNLASAVQALMQ